VNYSDQLKILYDDVSRSEIIEIADIPDIDLYMDQVTTFMETKLYPYKRNSDDKILTKTMINNYAKAKLFPHPVKKKYTKNHVMILIIIYHLKSMLSINDIGVLLNPITEELTKNPDSKILTEIYDCFVKMQKKGNDFIENKHALTYDFFMDIEVSKEIKNRREFGALIYVLGFSIFSNLAKRISEDTIDRII